MNAVLRSNKTLKYFALLVFCMEFLTPVFFFSSYEENEAGITQTQIQDHKQSSVSLASLFAEETINEEEREGSRSKDHSVIYHQDFTFSFLRLLNSVSTSIPSVAQNGLHRAKPAIYKINCLFRI